MARKQIEITIQDDNRDKGKAYRITEMSAVDAQDFADRVFFAAMKPPSLLVWINLFAFGGLEAVFFCPTLFGLYWKRANSTGAILSMICGAAAFFWFNITKTSIAGTTAIVPTLVIAIAAFVAGSLLGRPESEEKLKVFEI